MSHSDEILASFLLGAFVSWVVSYFVYTKEKRIKDKIHNSISHLSRYNGLTEEQRRRTLYLDISIDECVVKYRWAEAMSIDRKKIDKMEIIDPATLAAEAFICTKILGLTDYHALYTIARSVVRNARADELPKILHEVVGEIAEWQSR